MTKIAKIEGIGPVSAEKLQAEGITTVEALLEAGKTSQGRQALAGTTGINEAKISGWVNRADLMRIKGIGEEYGDLLESAGVDSVPELARRNAENLHAKLGEVNDEKKLVRQLPSLSKVSDWVEQAKDLPRVVTH